MSWRRERGIPVRFPTGRPTRLCEWPTNVAIASSRELILQVGSMVSPRVQVRSQSHASQLGVFVSKALSQYITYLVLWHFKGALHAWNNIRRGFNEKERTAARYW